MKQHEVLHYNSNPDDPVRKAMRESRKEEKIQKYLDSMKGKGYEHFEPGPPLRFKANLKDKAVWTKLGEQ